MNLEDLLSRLQELGDEENGVEIKDYASVDAGVKDLKKFLDAPRPDIAVGDPIERNEEGKLKYKFPKNGQAAICAGFVEDGKWRGRDDEDMIVLYARGRGCFEQFTVNSKYYKKSVVSKNVFSFKKRG